MTLLGDVSLLSQLEPRLAVWQAMIESQRDRVHRKEFERLWERLRRRRDLYGSIKKTDTAKSVYDAAARN